MQQQHLIVRGFLHKNSGIYRNTSVTFHPTDRASSGYRQLNLLVFWVCGANRASHLTASFSLLKNGIPHLPKIMNIENFWNSAFLAALGRLPAALAKAEADVATDLCIQHWQSNYHRSAPQYRTRWKDQNIANVPGPLKPSVELVKGEPEIKKSKVN
ncbi:hypothetical protein [Xanthomonas campestris]|uniref:Uncharacterized protein n=1 Tax=Xanthomonas campestris pv. papavericola TaxID=487881 RepID=A0AAJ3CEC8_XANCA|nr:hypothetical protein [Xanthomonas campestris]MEC3888873.1 hypothetical protein [Xanthomonas campestris pv. papavericola]